MRLLEGVTASLRRRRKAVQDGLSPGCAHGRRRGQLEDCAAGAAESPAAASRGAINISGGIENHVGSRSSPISSAACKTEVVEDVLGPCAACDRWRHQLEDGT